MSFGILERSGIAIKNHGVTVASPASSLDFSSTAFNTSASGSDVTVTVSAGSATEVRNEHPTDNGNGTYTLSQTPVAGTVAVYKNGQRLNAGAGNDYTISGTTITRLDAYNASDVFTADYYTV